jgi:hypothetical protein
METTFSLLSNIILQRRLLGPEVFLSTVRDTQGHIRAPESLQTIVKGDEMDRQSHYTACI